MKKALILTLFILISLTIVRRVTIKQYPFSLNGSETQEQVMNVLEDEYGIIRDNKIKNETAKFYTLPVKYLYVKNDMDRGWYITLSNQSHHISADEAFNAISKLMMEFGRPNNVLYYLKDEYKDERMSYYTIFNKNKFKEYYINRLDYLRFDWNHMFITIRKRSFKIEIYQR